MSDQSNLFPENKPKLPDLSTHGAVRKTDPPTSKVAAANVKANDLELVFLYCLYKNGNRTAEEVVNITGKAMDSITPRTAALKRKKLIIPTEETRRGKSGAKRIVWELTDFGREVVIRAIGEGKF